MLAYNNLLILYTDKEPIYSVPVRNILAVEKLEESAFNKKNVSFVLKYLPKIHLLCTISI